MKNNQNQDGSETAYNPLILEDEIHELADAIIEGSSKTLTPVDPFESYIDLLRTKFQSNPQIFRSRLAKGYQVLLQELQTHPEGEGSSKKSS